MENSKPLDHLDDESLNKEQENSEKEQVQKQEEASPEEPVSDTAESGEPDNELAAEQEVAAAPDAPVANKQGSGKRNSEEHDNEEEQSGLLDNDPTTEDAYEVDDYDADSKAHHDHDYSAEEKGDDHHESVPRDQKVNYELLSKEDLVKFIGEKMSTLSFNQLRGLFEEIYDIYTRKVEAETAEKKQKFLDEGGNEEDFRPVEDPVNQAMEELHEKYRTLKSDFNKQLEQSKEENLAEKQQILEEFRMLMEGQDTFDNTFRKFKQLQKRWFEIGIVPQQNVRDLWNSYNFFVDKFNDYVKINRELRVLDLKKNLDLKVKLCEKAEALSALDDVVGAFKTLQKYHTQWREIGPVPREDKDALWERFKAATSVINKAHQSHQSAMRESLVKNLEMKEKLCETAETLAAGEYNTHKLWSEKTNELLGIQEDWKKIGYAPKKHNNQIYARFRKACDQFFEKKAAFYAKTFEHQKENLKEKEAIVEEAEQLKTSTDWKETTTRLIGLQKKWKETGPVSRKDSDKLWKKFRSACDYFFNQKSQFYGGKDADYGENLKQKEALISEMEAYKVKDDLSAVQEDLDAFQERYNEIGFVPIEKKDEIRDRFKQAFMDLVDRTGMTEKDKSLMRFRTRMLSLSSGPRSKTKFRFERDKLFNKLQQLKTDISVWENNIGFFKESESAEDTISGLNDKIQDAHERIEILEGKLNIMDELENEF